MNYIAHYDRLIERARSRIIDGYRERHHVLPRCLGGSNDPGNIVELTGEEHYVAHQLLVRIHSGHAGIAYAAMKMAWQATGNKPYGWLRRRYAQARAGVSYQTGMKRSDAVRAAMSARRKGVPFPNRKRGIIFTDQHRANLSAAKLGKKRSPEIVAKVAAANRGRTFSAEHIEKLRTARRRRVTSPETRAKMSASRKGRKTGPMSAERKAALSAAVKAWWASGKGRNQWTTPSSSAS